MRRVTGALAVLAVAAAALAFAWRVAPAASPPLYDGICIADAYRTLGSSPPPSSASQSYPAEPDGAFMTSEVVTAENPPQGQLLMTDGTFRSATPFSVSITAVANPGPAPSDGSIDGNVYRMVATTASGQQLQPVDAQHGVTVLLRGTNYQPPRTLERLDGSHWVDLKTFNVSCGSVFEAVSTRMGDFALVVPKHAGNSGASGSGIPVTVAIVAGLTAVILATTLALIRLNRSRAH